MSFILPPESRVAVALGGVLVAVYPPKPYKRTINEVIVTCSVASSVEVYRDIIVANSRVAQNPFGSDNTFNPVNRPVIPAGSQVYVRWPSAGASNTAQSVITFESVD